MKIRLFTRVLSLILLLSLLLSVPAGALTAEEALGLSSTAVESSSGTYYPMLQYGSRDGDDAGAYVVMLQNRLIALGYLASSADGQYGASTQLSLIHI